MSDPLKNAGNFIDISGQAGKSLQQQVMLLRFAVAELLRHAEENQVCATVTLWRPPQEGD